ncbi:hypothetical protein [Bacillus dakarensis]|uniref:hypothetical protein n=1 Tax=Robertmurraya dakarensis TaxID=1926278 RepID=UPI0009822F24|nr:hypothetical protein [Bacillus dakarensis]
MELLFENPLIPIIVIWVISSLFNKGKSKKKTKTDTAKPFVENIPFPSFEDLKKEPEVIADAEPAISNIEEIYSEKKKRAEAQLAELKDKQRRASEKAERAASVSRLNQQRKKPEASYSEKAFLIEKEKVAEAIVWSEILGPPRAKKPHRSMK